MFTAYTKLRILRKSSAGGKVTLVITVTLAFVTAIAPNDPKNVAEITNHRPRFRQMFLAQYVQRVALPSPGREAVYSIKQFTLNHLRDFATMADGVHLSKCLRARGKSGVPFEPVGNDRISGDSSNS